MSVKLSFFKDCDAETAQELLYECPQYVAYADPPPVVDDAELRKLEGATALWYAAEGGNLPVLELLLARGADPNKATKLEGVTPLYMAAQNGHADCVEALLRHHAGVDTQRTTGATAVFIAAQRGHDAVVRVLLAWGADCEVPNGSGVTPMAIACYEGNVATVEALLAGGASLETVALNKTPIEWCQAQRQTGSLAAILRFVWGKSVQYQYFHKWWQHVVDRRRATEGPHDGGVAMEEEEDGESSCYHTSSSDDGADPPAASAPPPPPSQGPSPYTLPDLAREAELLLLATQAGGHGHGGATTAADPHPHHDASPLRRRSPPHPPHGAASPSLDHMTDKYHRWVAGQSGDSPPHPSHSRSTTEGNVQHQDWRWIADAHPSASPNRHDRLRSGSAVREHKASSPAHKAIRIMKALPPGSSREVGFHEYMLSRTPRQPNFWISPTPHQQSPPTTNVTSGPVEEQIPQHQTQQDRAETVAANGCNGVEPAPPPQLQSTPPETPAPEKPVATGVESGARARTAHPTSYTGPRKLGTKLDSVSRRSKLSFYNDGFAPPSSAHADGRTRRGAAPLMSPGQRTGHKESLLSPTVGRREVQTAVERRSLKDSLAMIERIHTDASATNHDAILATLRLFSP